MPCRRSVYSRKCFVDKVLSTKCSSTKCSVDKMLCRRKIFDNKKSTICLSTKNYSTKRITTLSTLSHIACRENMNTVKIIEKKHRWWLNHCRQFLSFVPEQTVKPVKLSAHRWIVSMHVIIEHGICQLLMAQAVNNKKFPIRNNYLKDPNFWSFFALNIILHQSKSI